MRRLQIRDKENKNTVVHRTMARNSDQFLRTVRAALAQWKHTQLQTSVKDEQDTTKLNVYLKQTANAYYQMKDYLNTDANTVSDPSLQDLLQIIGDKRLLSQEEEMLLQEYLFRDLIEYPFTYNTSLINSFKTTNALNTKIVPNK